jgi:hypothetical protein
MVTTWENGHNETLANTNNQKYPTNGEKMEQKERTKVQA